MTSNQYAYYPGCSAKSSARAYDRSAQLVSKLLDLTLQEIDDWNCCGATEYMSISAIPAYSVIARNLSQASRQNVRDLVSPCSACYLNLRKTNDLMAKYPDLNQKVNRALAAGGLSYTPNTVHVRHLLDVIIEDVGYERIAEKVKMPLKGLNIAPYYGCLIVRPTTGGYNPEYPIHLDKLMQTLGANVVDFPLKTHCCGGHMSQISEQTAFELIRQILQNAAEYNADAIVTLCPMCQLNLDAYQSQVNAMFDTRFDTPVLFFTQLMGLAFGLTPEDMDIGSEIVPAAGVLNKIGHEVPTQAAPKRRDKKALPMPTV